MKGLYRHGEVGFVKIVELPGDLIQSGIKVIMKGSHGNDHTFDNGKLYLLENNKNSFVNSFVFGYFVAKNTKLFHPEHSPQGIVLPNGAYQLVKQQEFTPEGLLPVVD